MRGCLGYETLIREFLLKRIEILLFFGNLLLEARPLGVEVHEAREGVVSMPSIDGPVYVTIDIDVLDPAFAPGMSHHEPGGWSTRQLLDALAAIGRSDAVVVGADIVEINPERDINGLTAMVGAKLVKELLELVGVSSS